MVHNPGSIPDDDRVFTGANVIVVFEGPYAEYASSRVLQNALHQLPSRNINNYGRQTFAYMFSDVPSNWSSHDLSSLINGMELGVQYIFVTDNDMAVENIYATFGIDWLEFVEIISVN